MNLCSSRSGCGGDVVRGWSVVKTQSRKCESGVNSALAKTKGHSLLPYEHAAMRRTAPGALGGLEEARKIATSALIRLDYS